MEIMEILSDALRYPFENIKALIVYLILGIILGIALAGTAGAVAAGVAANNALAVVGLGIIGIIVSLILGFVISGYELDIIKYGIERTSRSPEIDIVRQFINGVKLFIVSIVYLLIPIVITAILAIFVQNWVSILIAFILSVVFGLALFMAECRLAKSEDLFDALSIGGAINDIAKVGIGRLLVFIIVVFLIAFIIYFIAGLISQWNATIGGFLLGIVGVYLTFFVSRATGLLYSDV